MKHVQALTVFSVVCILSIGSVPARPATREFRDANNNYKFAAKALQAGNIKKAATYYRKALKILPYFPEAHAGMGHIAMGETRYEDALSEYEQAKSGYTRMGDDLFELDFLRYIDAQDQIRAVRDDITAYERLLRSNPSANPGTVERTITLLQAKVSQLETIKPPVKGVSLEPPGELFFYLGNALFHVGRIDEALNAWETCMRKSPNFPLVYNNLAVLYLKKQRFEDAQRCVEKAEKMGVIVNPALKTDIERVARDGTPNTEGPKQR